MSQFTFDILKKMITGEDYTKPSREDRFTRNGTTHSPGVDINPGKYTARESAPRLPSRQEPPKNYRSY